MAHLAILRAATLLLVLLLAAGCAGGGTGSADGETGNAGSSETTPGVTEGNTGPAPETTQRGGTTEEMSGGMRVEQISSGSGGLGQRQVVVGPSADALSEATGVRVPEAGEGTYLAAFWGEKPTGGYTMEILGARLEGDQIVVRLALKNPPPDAMVSQALTYPYVAAVVRGGIPEDADLVLVTQSGRELGWPVRRM